MITQTGKLILSAEGSVSNDNQSLIIFRYHLRLKDYPDEVRTLLSLNLSIASVLFKIWFKLK